MVHDGRGLSDINCMYTHCCTFQDWGDIPDAGEILGGVISGINDWGANALGGIANNVTHKNVLKGLTSSLFQF